MATKSNKAAKVQEAQVENPTVEAPETENKAPRGYYTDKDGKTSVFLNRVSSKLVFDVQNDPVMKRVSIPLKDSPTGRATISVAFADGIDSTQTPVKNQAKHSRSVVQNEDGSFSQGRASTDFYDINIGSPEDIIPVAVPEARVNEDGTPVLNDKNKPVYTTKYVDMKVEDIRAEFYAAKEAYAEKNAGKEIPEDDHGKNRIIRNVNVAMIRDNERYNEAAAKSAEERGQAAPEARSQVSFTDLPAMKDTKGETFEGTGRASLNVPNSAIMPARDRDRFGRSVNSENYRDINLGKEKEILRLNVCMKEADRDANGKVVPGTAVYETKLVSCDTFQKAFNVSKQVHKEHGPYNKDIDKALQSGAEMETAEAKGAEVDGPEM